MMNNFFKIVLIFILSINVTLAEVTIVPEGISAIYGPKMAIDTPTYSQFKGVIFKPFCFGQNNRRTNNPLDPKGHVVSTVTIDSQSYDIKFSSSLIKKRAVINSDDKSVYMIKMHNSCYSFCSKNPALCKEGNLDLGNSALETSLDTFSSRMREGLKVDKSVISGQLLLSDIMGIYKKWFIGHTYHPCSEHSINTNHVMDTSLKVKDYCLNTGSALGSCFRERMCEVSCAPYGSSVLSNKSLFFFSKVETYSSCMSDCKGKVAAASEGKGVCYVRPAKNNKADPSGYTEIDEMDCKTNNVSVALADSKISPDSKIKISHYQVNGKTGKPFTFYGFDGPMPDPKDRIRGSNAMALIQSEFPGQDGYCGGYHSPLMAFFDTRRPLFSSHSDLLFREKDGRITTWTEKNHPGYFVALLDKGSGAKKGIYRADQLFGNHDTSDGFEAMERIDSNLDGVIDRKDEDFNRLVLWKDKNGDSRSQPDELRRLSEFKIEKFDLVNRDETYRFTYGERAVARGRSLFSYSQKNNRRVGFLVDIFLSELN